MPTGPSFARVRVAHPGPVASHDRVAEECDAHNILAAVYQVPLVRCGPGDREAVPRENAREPE